MIREMTVADLPKVMEIEEACFASPWTLSEYQYELLDNPFSTLFVYEEAGEIIGMFDVWVTFEVAQLANIATKPFYQRQGIGQKLMDELIAFCERQACENITLEVRVSNESAIALYESLGFCKVAKRKQYYQDGEDAHLMILERG